MPAAPKKSQPPSEAEDDTAEAPAEETPPAATRDAKQIAKDVADPDRGKYEAEMIGDSTLIIRYEDGSSDSFTVESVTR